MPTIDQRILIPAPIEAVWAMLTDPVSIPRWDRTAAQITPLNQQSGVGARRRCVDSQGNSRVEEITAWLVPLGCEYKAVEGSYKSYTGRLRLQAVADGTQLQWTINYELGGALSGVRNALGHQRTLHNEMADSLRALRHLIEASGIHFEPKQHAKVTMQADPGFEARRARAGSATAAANRLADVTRATAPNLSPVDLSDPDLDLPPVEAVQAAQPPVNFARPAPITINEPPIAEEDTRQTAARRSAAQPMSAEPVVPPMTTPPASPVSQLSDDTPPRAIRRADSPSTVVARRDPPAAISSPPALPTPVTMPVETPPVAMPSDEIAPPGTKMPDGTADTSVWDVFGIVPPSQRPRAELDSLIAEIGRAHV